MVYTTGWCRNHLLALLSKTDAHGTGVLLNFTITDYKNGLALNQSGNAKNLVFIIPDHKTAGTHGAAT
jgi:hypothetical protein